MALTMDVTIDGIPQLRKRVAGMAARARNSRGGSAGLGEELLHRQQQRMAAGKDIHGKSFSRGQGRSKVPLGGNDRSMANSVHYRLQREGFDWYSTHPGAHAHQKGSTIRPKIAKFLTIPMRAKGGAREDSSLTFGRNRNRTGRRARDFKDTWFRWVRGRLYLFAKDKATGRPRALFLLLRQVKLRKNEWFGFPKPDRELIRDHYGRWIVEGNQK